MKNIKNNFNKLGRKEQLLVAIKICLEELGDEFIHQEIAYAKLFELDPESYQWETQPQWPDWKRCDSHLAQIRSPKYGKMFVIPETGRMLKISAKGEKELDKILKNIPIISSDISKKTKSREMLQHTKSIVENILKSEGFIKWKNSQLDQYLWEETYDCWELLKVPPTTHKKEIINILNGINKQIKNDNEYNDLSNFCIESIKKMED